MSNDIAIFASDLHIPYHNKKQVDVLFKVIKYLKPTSIDIVGDLDDACPVSRWNEGKPEEILSGVNTYAKEVQDFWRDVRAAAPNADLHYETGNHEARYGDYIDKKAPAFKDFITPEVLWKTDTYGVNVHWYNRPPVQRFKNLWLHHGDAISKYSGESVRKDMDNWDVSILRGHSHRMGSVFDTKSLSGRELEGHEIGHLTDIKSEGMSYVNNWPWQAGFAWAPVVNDVAHVQLVKFREDVAVVDRKVFAV